MAETATKPATRAVKSNFIFYLYSKRGSFSENGQL